MRLKIYVIDLEIIFTSEDGRQKKMSDYMKNDVCVCVCVCVCFGMHVFTEEYICLCVYANVCMYVCMYILHVCRCACVT